MLLSEPLASFIKFSKKSLIKFYLNSQWMSDSFYHITESSKLNQENKGSKHTHLAIIVLEFLRRMTS